MKTSALAARVAAYFAAALSALAVMAGVALAAPGNVDAGKALYTAHCAVCHGEKGDGLGKAAYLLYPRPRNFAKGVFKFRSTSSGSLPLDEDLFRTIANGLPGTGMPAWAGVLGEPERWDVIAYLKTLSTRFATEKPEAPVAIPATPPETPELVAAGKDVYARMKCFDCHGETGKGDGPSSDTMKDGDGVPMKPYDFTRGGNMKGGSAPADVYRTFTTGLDGTPMPSFEDALPVEDRWKLVYYVLSLGRATAVAPAKGGPILAAKVDGPLPDEVDAPAWNAATAVDVPLRPLWTRAGYADRVTVRALHDGRSVALKLEWKDAAADADTYTVDRFRDAAAVMFPVFTDADGVKIEGRPALTMGDPAHPVAVWHWKADWQADLSSAPLLASIGAADTYMNLENDPAFRAGEAAGNPMSTKHASPVESLVASGFGTLTSLPAQGVTGRGAFRDGSWAVVVSRPLFPEEPDGGATFADVSDVPVAFAVFDGAAKDRDGQKLFSEWTTLAFAGGPLQAPRGPWVLWIGVLLGVAALGAIAWMAVRSRRRAT